MVFPGYKSNNWVVTSMICATGVVLFWEFNAAFFSPIGSFFFPQLMGRYNAGVVPGVNEHGNRQYLRIKTAYDSQKPDYSKYTKNEE
jgi:hypothetical protein